MTLLSTLVAVGSAEAAPPADNTPNAVNWADISGVSPQGNANQTISGIDSSITLRVEWTDVGAISPIVTYNIDDGSPVSLSSGGTFSINNNETLNFDITAFGSGQFTSGVFTVYNESDGDAVLDTFTHAVEGESI